MRSDKLLESTQRALQGKLTERNFKIDYKGYSFKPTKNSAYIEDEKPGWMSVYDYFRYLFDTNEHKEQYFSALDDLELALQKESIFIYDVLIISRFRDIRIGCCL